MKDDRLWNGSRHCTLIESFDGKVIVLGPDCQKYELPSVEEAVKMVENEGWAVSVDHVHGSRKAA